MPACDSGHDEGGRDLERGRAYSVIQITIPPMGLRSVVQDLRDIVTTHMGEEIVTEVFVLREAELFVAGPEEDEIEEDISE
jgi:hypothetical protein